MAKGKDFILFGDNASWHISKKAKVNRDYYNYPSYKTYLTTHN
jgi:hypothetical protein